MPLLKEADLTRLLRDLRKRVEDCYGDRLRGLYLFGSYARGEADVESDVDVLIVLDHVDSYGREVDTVGKPIAELSLSYDIAVIPVFAGEVDWNEGERFFLANVRREARAA